MADAMLGALWRAFVAAIVVGSAASCAGTPDPSDGDAALIARGRDLFFNETFNGNGRTCATCHRAEDNFGLSTAFIATLPPNDPLFVAETDPALAKGFEAPKQMRGAGLILENLDGFDDLANKFVLRGVPHTLALKTSVTSRDGPHTGWGGDGAPGDGALRGFSLGAVIQHLPKTLARVPGEDFRLPTDDELDALEAFMLSTGRQEDLKLPLALTDATAQRGQTLFMDDRVGRCNICHFNAGANVNPAVFGGPAGNLNFNTGMVNLPDLPGTIIGDPVPPPDDGFRIPGDGTFNTPPLVEAADTGPFFHNNAAPTIEAAVAAYSTPAFNNSPAGQVIRQTTGSGIALDAAQVQAIAAFLRVINALENIRQSEEYLLGKGKAASSPRDAVRLAAFETVDAIEVLAAVNLHAAAVADLERARRLIDLAARTPTEEDVRSALAALRDARGKMLAAQPAAPISGQ
jgi:mono/diheme cytochrome c family protein